MNDKFSPSSQHYVLDLMLSHVAPTATPAHCVKAMTCVPARKPSGRPSVVQDEATRTWCPGVARALNGTAPTRGVSEKDTWGGWWDEWEGLSNGEQKKSSVPPYGPSECLGH